jgi:hypothetical protein
MIFDAIQFMDEEALTRLLREIEKYVMAHPAAG